MLLTSSTKRNRGEEFAPRTIVAISALNSIGKTVKVIKTVMRCAEEELDRINALDLIHTHTARRTGATLMYLSGMNVYDICKITEAYDYFK